MPEQPPAEPPATPRDFAVPADVVCVHHAGSPAVALCGRCGDLICELCTVRRDPATFCPTCSASVGRIRGLATHIPWERRSEIGLFQALYQTSRLVITNPRGFYRTVSPEGPMGDLVLFVVILRGTGAAVAQLGFAIFYGILALAMSSNEFAIQAGTQVVAIPFAYVGAVINAFLIAFICNLALQFLGTRYGFITTFRVHAYTAGIDVFQAIPFFGAFVVWPWSIYLHVVGFQEVHGMSTGKAVIAALAPMLIGMFLALGIFGVIMVAVFMAGV